MKYTAPIRHGPAQKPSGLSGWFKYSTANGANTDGEIVGCKILSCDTLTVKPTG